MKDSFDRLERFDRKKILSGSVLENQEIAEGIFRMTIESKEGAPLAKSGQFVNLYTKNPALLLPRPISICYSSKTELTLVYGVVGKGTAEFSSYKKGEAVRHSMPLGNGYDLSSVQAGQKALLLGGGIGVPPLLKLCSDLREKGVDVTAVIGFRKEPFLGEAMEKAGAKVYVATDSGAAGYKGTVLDVVQKEGLTADLYFACGPKVMLQAVCRHVLALGADIQLSMEERMGCGYGACVGCVCDVRAEDGSGAVIKKKVCKDGPVFLGSEVVWNGK